MVTGDIRQLAKTVGKDGKSRKKPRKPIRTVYVDPGGLCRSARFLSMPISERVGGDNAGFSATRVAAPAFISPASFCLPPHNSLAVLMVDAGP